MHTYVCSEQDGCCFVVSGTARPCTDIRTYVMLPTSYAFVHTCTYVRIYVHMLMSSGNSGGPSTRSPAPFELGKNIAAQFEEEDSEEEDDDSIVSWKEL